MPYKFRSALNRVLPGSVRKIAYPAVQAVLQASLAERFVSGWALCLIAEVYCSSSGYRVERTDVRFDSPSLDSSGVRLAWDVEYRLATEQYVTVSHQWPCEWNENMLLDGD